MRLNLIALFIITIFGCNNNPAAVIDTSQKKDTVHEKILFFPVTAYLEGQVMDIIKNKMPLKKYSITGEHTDSAKAKESDFKSMAQMFLQPEIDSTNLIPFFTESKFLDQSIDAFTFTYDAKPQLPDSVTLQHWDIYVEPGSGNVKRIYMLKKISADKQLQLTWQSNKWCKITTIKTSPGGASTVEKEEKISWGY